MNKTPADHVGLLAHDGVIQWPPTMLLVRDGMQFETARAAIGFSGNLVEIAWAGVRDSVLVRWEAPPPNRPNAPAPLQLDEARPWPVHDALAAGPALVHDGRIRVTADEEVFFGTSIPAEHPRTAAGVTEHGRLLFMVVDGRQPESRGVNLEELAGLMRSIGAVEALNLDGGGSSTLVVDGVRLNRPTGGDVEREVVSALVTFCR